MSVSANSDYLDWLVGRDSFDVGATLVKIIIDKEENDLELADNGSGCVDIEAMLRMGRRV
jgi:hypothetical protein